MWWLNRFEAAVRRGGEGFGGPVASAADAVHDFVVRERASASREFDPAEIEHGVLSRQLPRIGIALLPLMVVMAVNLTMSLRVLPRIDTGFLADARRAKPRSPAWAVWSVIGSF